MTATTRTNIFKRAILFLILGWVSIFSHASACSFTPAQLTGQANYRIYENRLDALLQSDDAYIAIIKTETQREYEDMIENIHEQTEVKTFLELKIKTIETLLGTSPDFSSSEWTKAPKFSEAEHAAEIEYASSQRPFGFWDQFSVSNPQIPWYGQWHMCGFNIHDALDTNTYYLVLEGPKNRTGLLPLSGLNDPIISDFKAIIAGAPFTKTRMTPRDFFRQIDGYNDVLIAACPGMTAEDEDNMPRPTSIYDIEDYTGEKTFASLSHHKSDLGHIRLLDLLGHNDWSTYFPKEACVKGTRYLVLETHYRNTRVKEGRFWANPPVKHRFLKVDNGVIDIADVKSNIEITGESLISAEKIKTWIQEGNQND